MQYYSEERIPHLLELPDGLSDGFMSVFDGKARTLGYLPVVDGGTKGGSPDFFQNMRTVYTRDGDSYVRTRQVIDVYVQFDPWGFLEAMARLCMDSNDSNDSNDSPDVGEACSVLVPEFDDDAFFEWFVMQHRYMRGETNSERLVSAYGDRELVERAIQDGR